MTSYSNAPALQFRVRWGFFRSVFFLAGTIFPTFEVIFFLLSALHLPFRTLVLFSSVCRCISQSVWLSICLSHSLSLSLPSFSSSSGPTQAFFLLDPRCQFMLVERSGVKVTPLCRYQLGVSVTLESLLLMLQACRSAFGLVSAVYCCICTHT